MAAALVLERVRPSPASLQTLAALRISVFRGWPYLYDGNAEYEAEYLSEFLSDPEAALIVARAGEEPVGMATASPMASQSEVIQRPLRNAGMDPETTWYFGESVLLPECRGQGIGHRFFDAREAVAREAGAEIATFCAVVRSADHPARPSGARDLGPFWRGRGYRRMPRIETSMVWQDLGRAGETAHRMQFWSKTLLPKTG